MNQDFYLERQPNLTKSFADRRANNSRIESLVQQTLPSAAIPSNPTHATNRTTGILGRAFGQGRAAPTP